MSDTLERIETKISYLEQANAVLSDVVYRQGEEIEALHRRLSKLIKRFDAAQESPAVDAPPDETPPHY